ncbi:MAG: hypothetical protein ACKOPS_13590 [Cyanobium sp.]
MISNFANASAWGISCRANVYIVAKEYELIDGNSGGEWFFVKMKASGWLIALLKDGASLELLEALQALAQSTCCRGCDALPGNN